jgi:hypothetical protein
LIYKAVPPAAFLLNYSLHHQTQIHLLYQTFPVCPPKKCLCNHDVGHVHGTCKLHSHSYVYVCVVFITRCQKLVINRQQYKDVQIQSTFILWQDSLHGTQWNAYHAVGTKWQIVAVYKNYTGSGRNTWWFLS